MGKEKIDLAKHTKEAIKASSRYLGHGDVLDVILDDDTAYTRDEVDGHIDEFLKREVE